jgi:hypothetical protein
MTFIQQLDLRTTSIDEIRALEEQWRSATEGRRTLRRSIIAQDRNDPNHYVVLAFFDDYASAMVNSGLPETDEFAAKQGALLEAPPGFLDLDVLEDR